MITYSCSQCKHVLESFFEMTDEGKTEPREGTLVLCPHCGGLSRAESRRLIKITNSEMNSMRDEILIQIQLMRFLQLKIQIERGEI